MVAFINSLVAGVGMLVGHLLPGDQTFLSLAVGVETHTLAFGRLHGDLQSATLILVTLIDLGQVPPMAATAEDRQQLLEKLLPGFKTKRTEWAQSEPTEVELGGHRFATVDWSAKADGKGMKGTLYVTVAGSKIVTLSAQDLQPFAGDTIPLAKEAFRTLALR